MLSLRALWLAVQVAHEAKDAAALVENIVESGDGVRHVVRLSGTAPDASDRMSKALDEAGIKVALCGSSS